MSETHHYEHDGGYPEVGAMPGGLAISVGGYTLKAAPTTFEAGQKVAFGFWILDRAGRAIHDFDEQHGVSMHLIVVRRDLSYYQHLHPSLGADGLWSVPLALPEPGIYRAFADFVVGGEALTLGTDLTVPGYYEPKPLPAPTGVAHADEYEVALDAGAVRAGAGVTLVFRITSRKREVTDLEPYLGALGHLVVLREGDLAYLHVHPTGGVGTWIRFHAVFPSLGCYRLFLQFVHEGIIHTASFTVEVSP